MKAKFKADTREALDKKIYEMIAEGWQVTKQPHKKLFGKWVCKMKLKKV